MPVPSEQSVWAVKHPLKADFSNLTLQQKPVRKPARNEIVIAVKAVSLNARDTQIASGRYPAPIQVEDGIIAASDAAGVVVQTGDDVSRFKQGDKVVTMFPSRWIRGDSDVDAQKYGLGGGIDGVLQQIFVCDEVRRNDIRVAIGISRLQSLISMYVLDARSLSNPSWPCHRISVSSRRQLCPSPP